MGIKNHQFNIVILILSGVVIAFILSPLISIFTFVDSSKLILDIYSPELVNAFVISLMTSTISTILLIIFGMPLAYCLARYSFRGKFFINMLVIFPLVLPPLASGALLLGIFSPNAVIGNIFHSFEFTESLFGIIIAQTYVGSPFMILASQASFEAVDESYENVSRVLGKSRLETFVRVTLPLAKPGLLISILLTWVRTIGELGATMMMSYNPHTISIQIFEDNAIGGLKQALPDILLVILLSFIALVIISIIKNKKEDIVRIRWS